MKRRSTGFLMVELLVALGIFCGVLVILFLALSGAGEATAVAIERATAALRLSQVLQEVRRGIIQVREGSSVEVTPADGGPLEAQKCVVKVEPWPKDAALRKVTITVKWQSRKEHGRSMSAVTLVRTKRLKHAEAER